jgi:hypothetical protein
VIVVVDVVVVVVVVRAFLLNTDFYNKLYYIEIR